MKSSEFKKLVENSLYNEVKKRIITESDGGDYDVFEVVCEGEPFEVCKTEEEAQEIVNKLEKQHPGKQFIIEKKTYKSYENMLDELDEMGEELQEKENKDMKNNKVKVGSLAEAILHAKENNKSKIIINEEVIDVNEKWEEMKEEETCEQCNMEEDEIEGGNYGSDYNNLPDDEEGQELEIPLEKKKSFFSKLNDRFNKSLGDYTPDYHEKYIGSMTEENMCSECGKGEINEEGQCDECGYMKESKKSKLRLKESELVSLIGKMVTEAAKGQPGIPGIPGVTVTKRAQSASEKENKNYAKELSTKLKKYLTFEGNDNPEFPKPIGKGSKMAFRNTSENEEKIDDKRGETNADLTFDYEPSEGFKKRVKKALEGDPTMGNSSDAGNVVKDKVGSKIVDKTERKKKNNKSKKEISWGHSWENPSDARIVKESNNELSNILKEEFEKIKKLSTYNKKTQ
jgi:hypothetical protein